MSLLKKTFLVITGVVILSTVVIYLASQITLLRGYEQIERDDTQAHVQRTLKGFEDQVQGVTLRARAYAVWDDMYNYVESPDPAFIDYLGLNTATFATHQIHMMAIVDARGQIAFLKMFDLETGEEISPPDALLAYLEPGSTFSSHTPGSLEKSAVLLLDGRPMVIVSLASLRTDFTGEPHGAVLMGRFVDEAWVAELGEITRLDVSAYRVDDPRLPRDVGQALSRLLASSDPQPIVVNSTSRHTIAGYTLITTLDHQPAFLFKIERPRDIYAHGTTSFRYFALLAAIAGAGFVLVTMLLLQWFVLAPLTRLSQQVSAIRASGDHSRRMTVRGSDELAQLGGAINAMLQALENHTNELRAAKQEADAARDKAEQADRVKLLFLANVSHELRTPLNAILNFTQFVSSSLFGPVNEKQADALQKVTQSSRHLLALINDILDMSKIEAGQVVLFIEKDVDLRPELDVVIASVGALLEGRPVALITEIESDLPAVVGDRRRIRQIFLNLASNAAKFTEKGYVKLRAWRAGDQVMFSVQDTGPGISPEDQAMIFEPFRQARNAAGRIAGTGLGLPISLSLTEAHQGKLWIESEVGEGTFFYVSLPICSQTLLDQLETPAVKET